MQTKTEQLKWAIGQWLAVAASEIGLAEHFDKTGTYGNTDSFRERAAIANTTAKALQLELETGVSHCNCHLGPWQDCPWRIKTRIV